MMNYFLTKMFLGFSEPATPIMEGVIDFHNYIFFFLTLIVTFVLFMVLNVVLYFWYFFERPQTSWDIVFREEVYLNNKITHGTVLEIIWTIIPALILVSIAFPSFSLLYSMDEVMMPAFTLKVVGHQWYWSYEYSDQNHIDFLNDIFKRNFLLNEEELNFDLLFYLQNGVKEEGMRDLSELSLEEKILLLQNLTAKFLDQQMNVLQLNTGSQYEELSKVGSSLVNDDLTIVGNILENVEFDSYMVPEEELALGDHRLLEVTESVVLPVNTYLRLLITSADVLHSFAVPSLGIKADAVPGRLNQLSVFLKRSGVFYGQCSEICGVSHGMMPIVIRGVSLEEYIKWLVALGPKGNVK